MVPFPQRAICLITLAVMLTASGPELPFLHRNSPTKDKYLIEAMGGGVALLDYDKDGRLDVFLVNSGRLSAGMQTANFARQLPVYWNRLYRQAATGKFVDVTQAAGLAIAGNGNYGMGVAAADFDNDGWTDLYVTSYGQNKLYRNNGDGTFRDVTEQAGVAGEGWSVSAGFFDYDNDGHLDLFVTRYMDWSFAKSKVCERETYCPPGAFPTTTNLLFRNLGNGKFHDASVSSGIGAKRGRALGVAFNDFDGDGFSDVFVANDGMQQFLFRNRGNGTFEECGLEAGVAFSDDGKPISGMGVDFQDYDNDGRPDLIITDLPRQAYALYKNDGGGAFSYRSREAGITSLTAGSAGWGVRLEDFDNDGWKDVLFAQGHVMDNVETLDGTLHYRELPMLAWNRSGRFSAGPAFVQPVAGRGAAFGDLDGDGTVDAVIGVLGGAPVVWRNRTRGGGHWLTVDLKGTRSNRDGAGAIVKVNGQMRYASSAGSYASASDRRVHFGLGAAQSASVEVLWPSGKRQKREDVAADQVVKLEEQ